MRVVLGPTTAQKIKYRGRSNMGIQRSTGIGNVIMARGVLSARWIVKPGILFNDGYS